MTESLLGVRNEIVDEDLDGNEIKSTFDRLLRDYFGPQAVHAAPMSHSHTSSPLGLAPSCVQRGRQ